MSHKIGNPGYVFFIVITIGSIFTAASPAHSAERAPFWANAGKFEFFWDGAACGNTNCGVVGSENEARAAQIAWREQFTDCTVTLKRTTKAFWYWGSHTVFSEWDATLKAARRDFILRHSTNAPACTNNAVEIETTLTKKRELQASGACPAAYNGPFQVKPGGPWYICRDDEKNFLENPLLSDCPPTAGNPCELTTGAKIERVTDYSGPGIEFYRTFRSNIMMMGAQVESSWEYDDVLGKNWTHNYASTIRFASGPTRPVYWIGPDGAVVKLFEIDVGVFIAGNGSGIQVRPADPANYGGDWVVYLPSGATEVHKRHLSNAPPYAQARHYLKELHDPQGRITTVNYGTDNSGNELGGTIESVVGPFGHTLQFNHVSQYFGAGVSSFFSMDYFLDAAGQKVDFVQQEDDPSLPGTWLKEVIYQDQTRVRYRYPDLVGTGNYSDYFLRGIIDEKGSEFATFEYYSEDTSYQDNRIKSTRHGAYEFTGISYAYTGETATVTDALGNATVYQFQATPGLDPYAYQPGWIARNSGTVTYPDMSSTAQANEPDGQRRVTQRVDENGLMTRFDYDDYHRISMQEGIDPASGVALRTTSYQYLNDTSDLKTLTRTPSVACPGRFRVTTTAYAPGTQWVASITESGYAPQNCSVQALISRTTIFSDFNTYGQPRSITGPRGSNDQVLIEYYECESGGACGQVRSVTNALGHVTRFQSYDAHGRLLQATDPNGVVTTISYTLRGLVDTITRTWGTDVRSIDYDYDPIGQIDFVTLPDGVTLDFEWNEAHLLDFVVDAAGSRIDYSYDSRGNRDGEILSDFTGGIKKSLAMLYDSRNLVDWIQAGANSVTDTVFDSAGRLRSEVDPNGNVTDYRYDGLNRLNKMIDAFNKSTQFGYDIADNPTAVIAPNLALTAYEYDDLGNLLKEISPDRGTTLYRYDQAGNMTCKADSRITAGAVYADCAAAQAAGAAWVYAYDALNRIDTIDYLNTAAIPDVDYDYDAGTGQAGRLTSVLNTADSGGMVLTDYQYDGFGNRLRQTETIPARTGTQVNALAYEYDGNNQVKKITYPNGRVVNYTRTRGRVTRITTASPFDGRTITLVKSVKYQPFGPPSTILYGNGLTQVRNVDTAYQPTSVALGNIAGVADGQGYTLDPAGNVTKINDWLDPADTVEYRYDVLNRLIDDSRIDSDMATDTYAYDENGNRLRRNADRFGFSDQTSVPLPASNRLSTINGSAVSYDAAGNMLDNGLGVSAIYAASNRLAGLSRGGTTTTHLYNGRGELAKIKRQSNCDCTCQYIREYYAFAPDGRVLHFVQEKGARASTDYIWLDGLPIAAIEERFNTRGKHQPNLTKITYLHPDHLGTPVLGTDVDQVVVWKNTPDAFGRAVIDSSGPDIRLRFPGQIDYGIGRIYYNYYRDYDSNTGRYLQSDPLGLDGGLNTYGYAGQNPLTYTDPSGLLPVFPPEVLDFLTDIIDVGIGATVGIVDVTVGTGGTDVSLTTPGLGVGVFACINLCSKPTPSNSCSVADDPPIESLPLTFSAGPRRLGVSFTEDACTICGNLGPAFGFPVNVGIPIK